MLKKIDNPPHHIQVHQLPYHATLAFRYAKLIVRLHKHHYINCFFYSRELCLKEFHFFQKSSAVSFMILTNARTIYAIMYLNCWEETIRTSSIWPRRLTGSWVNWFCFHFMPMDSDSYLSPLNYPGGHLTLLSGFTSFEERSYANFSGWPESPASKHGERT